MSILIYLKSQDVDDKSIAAEDNYAPADDNYETVDDNYDTVEDKFEPTIDTQQVRSPSVNYSKLRTSSNLVQLPKIGGNNGKQGEKSQVRTIISHTLSK